jgi:AcrR family transcriptional regulator
LLVAALDVFIAKGYGGTTIPDIERAVGLAAGTGSFYRHFPSKEAIFIASVEAGLSRMVDEALAERADLLDLADPAERLRLDYENRLRDLDRFKPLWTLIASERERFPDLLSIYVRGLRFADWDAGWKDHPAEAIGFAAIVGYSQLSILGAGPFRSVEPSDFIEAVVGLVSSASAERMT